MLGTPYKNTSKDHMTEMVTIIMEESNADTLCHFSYSYVNDNFKAIKLRQEQGLSFIIQTIITEW